MRFEDNPFRVVFNDKDDEKKYSRFLNLINQNLVDKNKNRVFVLTISIVEDLITKKQIKLWNFLVFLIAKESGNDFRTVNQTILNECGNGKEVEEMLKNEFYDFIEKTILFTSDFFDLNIIYNQETEQFDIKKR